MELINRYVYQVGRRLPKRLRDDVTEELRSLLLDTLEERTGNRSEEVSFSEEDQIAILKEFGSPAQMAAKYQPRPQYLIGPKVYSLYLLVVAAVAGAGLLASMVSTAVLGLYSNSANVEWFILVGQGIMRFFTIAISGIGSVTITFAILERVIPDEELKLEDEEEWNPRDLPAIEEQDQIKPSSLIVETGFLALLLMAFAAFADRIPMGLYYDEGWHIMSTVLSPAFFSLYLPLIEIRWGLTIMLNLVLLRQGRWQLGSRIADLLFQGLDIFILVRMVSGPSVLHDNIFEILTMQDTPVPSVDSALRLALLVALIVVIIETVRKLYRLLRSESRTAFPTIDTQKTIPH
ncbi:MAG: hypothetical protein JXA33_23785 [Anaerolineae bacterium]|nr:hypothetical protein [Anaerolineae bacterium]